jgi:hypothetical protein
VGRGAERFLVFLLADGLKKANDFRAILGRCDAAIGLHVVPGHDLVRIGDKAVERGLVPHEVRALHSARIAIVWQRSGLAAEDLV